MNDFADHKRRYIGQICLALQFYKSLLNGPIITAGDFNWNVIWDRKPSYPLYEDFMRSWRSFENKT